jgi:hypothetical protein
MNKPNPEKEEFVQGYRFLRVPVAYMGEAFTKAFLYNYIITKDLQAKKFNMYQTSYELKLTANILKKHSNAIQIAQPSKNIVVISNNELAKLLLSDYSKSETKLVKEFKGGQEQIINIVFNIKKEAKERGWVPL